MFRWEVSLPLIVIFDIVVLPLVLVSTLWYRVPLPVTPTHHPLQIYSHFAEFDIAPLNPWACSSCPALTCSLYWSCYFYFIFSSSHQTSSSGEPLVTNWHSNDNIIFRGRQKVIRCKHYYTLQFIILTFQFCFSLPKMINWGWGSAVDICLARYDHLTSGKIVSLRPSARLETHKIQTVKHTEIIIAKNCSSQCYNVHA